MLSVSDNFHRLARAQIIVPRTRTQISFSKEKREDVKYFTLDVSQLDGSDLLAPTGDNPIQLWDTYAYKDYSNRIVDYTLTRSLEFPNSAQSAILDITLNDYDRALSYPANANGLPKRPIRLFEGFDGDPNSVQSFVGLTQGVVTENEERTVTLTCMDFLTEISDQTLRRIVKMRDVTTDQVLLEIVKQFGVTELQCDFEKGNNLIPFVFMDTEKNAGNAITELVLAEGGRFWQDEEGILRFRKRLESRPDVSAIYKAEDIMNITPQTTSGIYNVVNIECEIRKIQSLQEIFSAETDFDADSEDYYVKANGTYSIFLGLDDPAWTANLPTLNGTSSNSSFTAARTNNGATVTSNITAEGTLFTDTYLATFTNNNNFPVRITSLSLWGEPARVVDTIKYTARDTDSIAEFGEMPLNLTDNKYIASMDNARSLASEILARRSGYNTLMAMECKYDPSLQIGDTIYVDDDTVGYFAIIGVARSVANSSVNPVYYLEKDWRLDVNWFILDQSVLDGPDLLA